MNYCYSLARGLSVLAIVSHCASNPDLSESGIAQVQDPDTAAFAAADSLSTAAKTPITRYVARVIPPSTKSYSYQGATYPSYEEAFLDFQYVKSSSPLAAPYTREAEEFSLLQTASGPVCNQPLYSCDAGVFKLQKVHKLQTTACSGGSLLGYACTSKQPGTMPLYGVTAWGNGMSSGPAIGHGLKTFFYSIDPVQMYRARAIESALPLSFSFPQQPMGLVEDTILGYVFPSPERATYFAKLRTYQSWRFLDGVDHSLLDKAGNSLVIRTEAKKILAGSHTSDFGNQFYVFSAITHGCDQPLLKCEATTASSPSTIALLGGCPGPSSRIGFYCTKSYDGSVPLYEVELLFPPEHAGKKVYTTKSLNTLENLRVRQVNIGTILRPNAVQILAGKKPRIAGYVSLSGGTDLDVAVLSSAKDLAPRLSGIFLSARNSTHVRIVYNVAASPAMVTFPLNVVFSAKKTTGELLSFGNDQYNSSQAFKNRSVSIPLPVDGSIKEGTEISARVTDAEGNVSPWASATVVNAAPEKFPERGYFLASSGQSGRQHVTIAWDRSTGLRSIVPDFFNPEIGVYLPETLSGKVNGLNPISPSDYAASVMRGIKTDGSLDLNANQTGVIRKSDSISDRSSGWEGAKTFGLNSGQPFAFYMINNWSSEKFLGSSVVHPTGRDVSNPKNQMPAQIFADQAVALFSYSKANPDGSFKHFGRACFRPSDGALVIMSESQLKGGSLSFRSGTLTLLDRQRSALLTPTFATYDTCATANVENPDLY